MTVVEFNEEEDDFKQLIEEKKDKPTFIYFNAEWCGPCLVLRPALEKICKENNFNLISINVDDNPEISEDFRFQGIPYVILSVKGKKVFDFTGYKQEKLEEAVKLVKNKII